MPLNRLASGVVVNLEAGTYIAEVAYYLNLGRARYALRVFPGTVAPDYDPTEPNDTPDRAINLGRLSGGEIITQDYRYLSYGGGDVDVYQFDLDNLRVLFDFGRSGFMLDADVNGDSTVDDADLLEVLFQFGAGCR
jgi:hypothetical protein